MIDKKFWSGKRVVVTGHTGFKGAWLSLWLHELGAKVFGYSLAPNTTPNLFDSLNLSTAIQHNVGDIRNRNDLRDFLRKSNPEIILHLAAQPLVLPSYEDPLETYETNVMGTAYLLNDARTLPDLKTIVVVTSDKCYENKEWVWPYRESDPMGGYDPYSASKGCAELLSSSFRRSYFNQKKIALVTARAGNVIGGGDWSENRLVPDIMKHFFENKPLSIRNPKAIRPWQHVLEPLHGYLLLAQASFSDFESYSTGWNFGPEGDAEVPVDRIIEAVATAANKPNMNYDLEAPKVKEANFLRLDNTFARSSLGWTPKLNFNKTISWTVDWYKDFYSGTSAVQKSKEQLSEFQALINTKWS